MDTAPAPDADLRPLILVADDEEAFLKALQKLLDEQGFRVVTAKDGQEAAVVIRHQRPALVIADVMMPKLDGFQLCRLIKFDKQLKSIPIILLTARSQESDRYTGRGVQANDYLTKPFKTQHLLGRINFWLGRQPGITPTIPGPGAP